MDLQELKSKLISERKELAEKIMRLTAKLYSGYENTEKELISAYQLRKQLERAVDEHIKKVEQQAIDRLQPRLF